MPTVVESYRKQLNNAAEQMNYVSFKIYSISQSLIYLLVSPDE
jgi:hypothetical protein